MTEEPDPCVTCGGPTYVNDWNGQAIAMTYCKECKTRPEWCTCK